MAEITIINNEDDDKNPKNFSKGYLTLPFEGNQFKDFITGLLGKPQSITKIINGTFEIHLSDLQSLFDLVNQRITQQNNGRLIQFIAKVYFRDKSTVQLGSYEELITYNEVKPVISDGVKLSWDYLIQFGDKNHAEKQTIEITFTTGNRMKFESLALVPSYSYNGHVAIDIQHTARSWGSDIEAMLTNQVKSLMKSEHHFKRIIRENSGLIGLVSGILFFLITLIGAYKITNNFMQNEITKVKLFNSSKIHTAAEKLDFLTSYVASGASSQHYFQVGIFMIIMIIFSIAVGVFLGILANDNDEPSFLLLTRKSVENKNSVLKKLQKSWVLFFVSAALSLISGVVSNYIFNYIIS